MYNIQELIKLEGELKLSVRKHFEDFFSKHDYTKDTKAISTKSIASLADVDGMYYGTGLYVILSDYQAEQNKCSLIIDDLKAIYRGHCYTVKKRLKSHLFNEHYRRNLSERGVRYDVCMKLDDKNGINIDSSPYNNYRWKVVTHKMRGSSKMIREQAELAFDEVFGRPLGSREAGQTDA